MAESLSPETAPIAYDDLVQEAASNHYRALSGGDAPEVQHWHMAFLLIAKNRFDYIDDFSTTDLMKAYRYTIDQYYQATGSDFWQDVPTTQRLRTEFRDAGRSFYKKTTRKLSREGVARGILNERTGLMSYRPVNDPSIAGPPDVAKTLEPNDTKPDQS